MADSFWYAAKRHLLGAPLVNEQLATERLSKPMALGILSCDGISSAAYGTEMMLLVLMPFFGLAAFSLILPLTLVIMVGIFLVMLSYREVVSVYTRAGGSYIVARENFGPRVAQVAAVALLIDYVVTLAVQTAAGSAAIVSAFPSLTRLGTSPQRSVILFVDRYDLATIAALRYAWSLRPASLRVVHLTIDQAHAKRLADRWLSAGAGIPLELVDCPGRSP
jgi:amino acid transporter